MHEFIYSAFPRDQHHVRRDGRIGILYRREPEYRNGCVIVLVQSLVEPDWRAGLAGEVTGARRPQVMPLRIAPGIGSHLRFRLRANPTRREPARHAVHRDTDRPKDGPRVSITHKGVRRDRAKRELEQILGYEPRSAEVNEFMYRRWLEEQLEGAGVTELKYGVVNEGLLEDKCRGLKWQSVLFDGTLRVVAPERLRKVVAQGVGTARAFGFGLLSLAPAR
jgi:CRISPR system Cascade subunit CasE